ncbi:hypothetical protein HQ346_16945 [Rhodococcus sp. BP-252]|nr:hypothetical protein [Rhodococcus sp. BP-320]MBY6418012.1 hypothetical protein [Rhodococcus sp. BP-321]MBY6422298.1 hypothetical protein [Rhodococcus sp. BP-324]MBY6428061.1 hypothetical protein [Rhodococcus sp. BP-323]MBY6433305.1 hypothetical protein [Rhodococcus sp. BP-322]MBY6442233.1 hypothetical protein [Rhodococcus sp. BP-319]MBY6451833.1 hypothetical protein [Rhodococcus sp. BP-315]MBY6461511.1 hypothetical protein [Rhodococcus sp. BP-260]MBY6471263.1 hypothetical protein [Rhodoc
MPVAIALACGVGTAHAAPQDFVTAPDTAQSGTTDTTPVAPPPAPTQERQFVTGYQPSPRVQQSQWRSYDDYQSGNQQSSYQTTYYEQAPTQQAAPTEAPPALQATPPPPPPVPTVQRTVIAPVDAPDGYILAGGQLVPYDPNLIDPNLVEQFNNTAAALQADGGNWLVDNGFADAPQADRIAAGTATGVITGGITGLAASLIPATVITGTAAAIGGGLGVAATTGTGAIVWGGPVGWVFIPGAAALAGAGVGAASSAPIVLGLTAAGAGIGAVLGGTVLGGEQQIIEEPAPLPAPETAPAPPAAPLTLDDPADSVQSVIDTAAEQIDGALNLAPSEVGQAGNDAQVWTEPAYEAVQGFTTTVLQQPAVADTIAAVNTAAAPLIDQANTALAGLNLGV